MALLAVALGAVGISAAGIAVAAVLLTQHLTHEKDRPTELAASIGAPADQAFPDRNPRPNGRLNGQSRLEAREARAGDRGNFQGRGAGGNFQGRGGGMMMLNEDQRQALQDAQQDSREKLRELEEKLHAAQKEILEAAFASVVDEKAIRSKAEAMASIQVEMTLLRAKALSTVAPGLEPEQKQQLTESPFGVMFLNGVGMMGGGGGRGGFAGGMGGGGPGGGGRTGGGPDNPGPRPDR
jgi:Spy/CpxP family protein refolding chaperone